MIALYIIGGIILLILFLLFMPVTFTMEYEDEFNAKLQYLFFTYKLNDEKKKKKKRIKKSKKKKEKKNKNKESGVSKNLKIIKESFKLKGFEGAKNILRIAAYFVKKISKLIKNHLIIRDICVMMSVGGNDAADTSVKYGKLCAVVFPSLGAIVNTMKVRNYDVQISPDFMRSENKAYIYAKLQMRAAFILAFDASVLFKLILGPIIGQKIKNINNKAVQKNEGK